MTQAEKIPGLAQLIRNSEAFKEHQDELKREHARGFAIFVDGELKKVIDDVDRAYEYGFEKFGYGKFTLHEIGARTISLGSGRPYSIEELIEEGRV